MLRAASASAVGSRAVCPVSSFCSSVDAVWQNTSFGAHTSDPEVLGRIYRSCLAVKVIITLNSGCLCVRPRTWRRWCLSCFFCLPCLLLSISSLLWCLACLSCSFLAFLFHFPSAEARLPLIFSYSLFDISFWVVVSLLLFLPLSRLVSLWCPRRWLNDWSHKALPPTHVHRAELSCAAPLILLLSPS